MAYPRNCINIIWKITVIIITQVHGKIQILEIMQMIQYPIAQDLQIYMFLQDTDLTKSLIYRYLMILGNELFITKPMKLKLKNY